MIDDTPGTSEPAEKFDFSSFPEDTLFHERRYKGDRRGSSRQDAVPGDASKPRIEPNRRVRKERRRRVDPTTFEKQYTDDEMEFMNAMQEYKIQSCKSFPSYGEVLEVAYRLGYRKAEAGTNEETGTDPASTPESPSTEA